MGSYGELLMALFELWFGTEPGTGPAETEHLSRIRSVDDVHALLTTKHSSQSTF